MSKRVEKIDITIARSAYESMCRSNNKKPGEDVPNWDELGKEMQKAWGDVGQTVVGCLYMEVIDAAKEQAIGKARAKGVGDER